MLSDLYPDLVLVPSGGKGLITSFHTVISEVLEKTLWGVDFFMLCDHDALPSTIDPNGLEGQAKGRLRVLPRYHLENYFLDAAVLARVFAGMEPDGSWLRDPQQIDELIEVKVQALKSAGPKALAASKQLIEEVSHLSLEKAGEITARYLAERRASSEAKEGIEAFFNKRKPRWVP